MRYRTRLTVVFLLLIGISVLTAGLFSAQLLRNSYMSSLETNMDREIRVLLATSDWSRTGSEKDTEAYYTSMIRELRESAGSRVTYIRADGKVLGDSDHDIQGMGNHLDREEVKESGVGKTGYAVRHSETLNQNMMYAAEAVADSSGKVVGYIRLAMSLSDVEDSLRRFWLFLLAGLAALVLIAGVISYRIARSMTRPLEKITRVAQQITNLDYRSRVEIHSKDEIGQLGLAINTMAESLQTQLGRIVENESRLQSVMDSMQSGIIMIDREERIMLLNRKAEEFLGFTAEELLNHAYTAANQQYEFSQLIQTCLATGETLRDEMVFYFPEERIMEVSSTPVMDGQGGMAAALVVLHDMTAVRRLEKMRSEFVANVSHELKTPIAAVKGFAETLLNGALDDEEAAHAFVKIIYDESERLNRLIGDILALSKIESRRVPLDFSPIDLNEFLKASLRMVQTEADKKHIRLDLLPAAPLYLEADEDRLRQILLNLLSNSISYTPEGGEIHVRAEHVPGATDDQDDRVRISVTDTGIGIPKKDLPRIFERFYRVDKARSRSSGGTGLGLSIVKHLVELHRGTIRVESTVGVGSSFIIELPVIHQ
ncbi:two-component system histidine kinase PnpS [Gorillibacterium timonense]|uniref:two-component system histidine kinase PnpS n=1 Tax=Gorillibacterium timonense TaxID=1689269 RepID=UPI00071E2EB8|nr:ATP-binding protein [Gorillibacterium timonense]